VAGFAGWARSSIQVIEDQDSGPPLSNRGITRLRFKGPKLQSVRDNQGHLIPRRFTSGKIVGSLSKALNSKRNISAH